MYKGKLVDIKIGPKKTAFYANYANVTSKIRRSLLSPSKRGTKMKQTTLNTPRLMFMQKTCLLNNVKTFRHIKNPYILKIVATPLATNPRKSAVDREDHESN